MREFELVTEISAPRDAAWQALLHLPDWPRWNRLVPVASGRVRTGEVLDFRIRRVDGSHRHHRPAVLEVEPPHRVVLAAGFVHPRLVHMVHSFTIEPLGPGRSLLWQHWTVTGFLVPILWPMLKTALSRFAELGEDLSRWVALPAGDRRAAP